MEILVISNKEAFNKSFFNDLKSKVDCEIVPQENGNDLIFFYDNGVAKVYSPILEGVEVLNEGHINSLMKFTNNHNMQINLPKNRLLSIIAGQYSYSVPRKDNSNFTSFEVAIFEGKEWLKNSIAKKLGKLGCDIGEYEYEGDCNVIGYSSLDNIKSIALNLSNL